MANCMEKEEEDTVQNNVDKGRGEKKENTEVDIFGAEKESSEEEDNVEEIRNVEENRTLATVEDNIVDETPAK